MDVGWESNDNDAVEGKVNPINHENGDDDIQYGYRLSLVTAANIVWSLGF